MRIILRLAVLSIIFLLVSCSACRLADNSLPSDRESPSYVVKKFWHLAQENDYEKARQLVAKSSIDMETNNERQDEFQTPGFIKLLQNQGDRMQSICECEADAVTFANVLLKVEKGKGGIEVYRFMLSERNAKKVWKIVWVSKWKSDDIKCSQHN